MINITSQDWFCDERSQKVMHVLASNGKQARFVGGCVRDALIGREVHDIDIATPEKPQVVEKLLQENGIKTIPTGIEHGTITAVFEGLVFEITTLRSDVSTDGRRATVAFSEDWLEDAARRDFTFNALSVGLDGVVHDPFDGVADLQAGRVRFVGAPHQRIEEDYLRLLRFFRFSAYFAKAPMDGEALQACIELAPKLSELSGERITQELLKLLSSPRPAKWISLMQNFGIMNHLITGTQDSHALEMMCAFEEKPDGLRRLSVLLNKDADTVEQVIDRLKLSKKQSKRLRAARLYDGVISIDNIFVQLYRFGAETVQDRLFIYWAEKQFSGLGPAEQSLLHEITRWKMHPRAFPLSGKDLLERGFTSGPQMGEVLSCVEDWWCENQCQPDREACLTFLASLR